MLKFFFHRRAQRYESSSNRITIQTDFRRVYESWEQERAAGHLWQTADDMWFQGDATLWSQFVDHVRDRKCLEIGSGPFGYLAPCYWIKDRVIVDPLIDAYRKEEMKLTGKTFFTDDIRTLATGAETFIEDLSGAVNGFIVCQNALDHCKRPFKVLKNIGRYAAPGCFLLLWTDIWHLEGVDAGHRNITRSEAGMDAFLRDLGFEIVKTGRKIRDSKEYVEYGRLMQKVPIPVQFLTGT